MRAPPLLEVASALAATAERGDTRAADLLSQAGATLAAFDPSTAADLVGRAVEITVDDPERHRRLLTEQVMLLWQAGRADDARVIGERALVAGVSPAQEAEVRLGPGAGRLRTLLPRRRPPDRDRAGAARPAARSARPPARRPRRHQDHGRRPRRPRRHARRSDDTWPAASSDVATQTSLLATRSTLALHRLQWDAAFELAEQGRRLAEAIADPTSMWSPKGLVAWQAILLSTAGSSDEALRITDQGIADASAARQGAAVSLWMMIRSPRPAGGRSTR